MQTYRKRVTRVQRTPRLYGDVHAVKPKPKRRVSVPWRSILGAAVIVWLVYLLFFSSVFTVKTIEVYGTSVTDEAQFERALQKGISIWHSQQETVDVLVSQSSAIAEATVLRGLPHTLRVNVVEYLPKLIWLSRGQACLVTQDGYVIAEYPEAALTTDERVMNVANGLPRVIDGANVEVKLDQQVASQPFVDFISQTKEALEKLTPQYQMQQAQVADSLFDITVILDGGVELVLSTAADVGVQTRNFARLVRDGVVSQGSKVDLRVDRWAYVSPL